MSREYVFARVTVETDDAGSLEGYLYVPRLELDAIRAREGGLGPIAVFCDSRQEWLAPDAEAGAVSVGLSGDLNG